MQSMQPPTQPTRLDASNSSDSSDSSSSAQPPAAAATVTVTVATPGAPNTPIALPNTPNTPSATAAPHEDSYPSMDNFRRRAVSEVVRQSSSKWKIVAAFNNLRKSWEKDEHTELDSRVDADLYGDRYRRGEPDTSTDKDDTSGRSMGASDMDSGSFRKYGPGESGDRNIGIPTYYIPSPPEKAAAAAANASSTSADATATAAADPQGSNSGGKVGADGTKIRPRKRVSLFLRRRGRFRGGNVPHSVNPVPRNDADTDASGTETQHFRRAQSHFVKPVSVNNEGAGGTSYIPASESGRYMEYAADFDFTRTINSLRKLRPSAIRIAPPQTTTAVTTDPSASGVSGLQPNNNNNNNNNSNSNSTDRGADGDEANALSGLSGPGTIPGEEEEIIGEICLEDFADTGSEDFAFLDGQIVDVWTDDEDGEDDGSERVPTLRLDGQKISLFGEEEFAQFCKELLKPPKPTQQELESFTVDEQWKDDTRIHNRFAAHWCSSGNGNGNSNSNNGMPPGEDIRTLSYAYN